MIGPFILIVLIVVAIYFIKSPEKRKMITKEELETFISTSPHVKAKRPEAKIVERTGEMRSGGLDLVFSGPSTYEMEYNEPEEIEHKFYVRVAGTSSLIVRILEFDAIIHKDSIADALRSVHKLFTEHGKILIKEDCWDFVQIVIEQKGDKSVDRECYICDDTLIGAGPHIITESGIKIYADS